jgi:hypothetical protein
LAAKFRQLSCIHQSPCPGSKAQLHFSTTSVNAVKANGLHVAPVRFQDGAKIQANAALLLRSR